MKAPKDESTILLEHGSTCFDNLDMGVILLDHDLRMLYINHWFKDLLTVPISDKDSVEKLFAGRDFSFIQDRLEYALRYQVVQTLSPVLHPYVIPLPDERFADGLMKQRAVFTPVQIQLDEKSTPIDGVQIQVVDISHACHQLNLLNTAHRRKKEEIRERIRIEQRLEASLQEKEVLLKEIHHRVKNQMQAISSLLNMQMRRTSDEVLQGVLNDCQLRVQSMASIHQILHESSNLSSVDIRTYLTRLVKFIVRSYDRRHLPVETAVSIACIQMTVDQANNLGLIVNELVSNAMKYAFTECETGKISVTLSQNSTGEIELVIADNGTGLPEAENREHPDGLGLNLVRMLVENQFHGDFQIHRSNGTQAEIRFHPKNA